MTDRRNNIYTETRGTPKKYTWNPRAPQNKLSKWLPYRMALALGGFETDTKANYNNVSTRK